MPVDEHPSPLLTIGYSCLADRVGQISLPDERDVVEFVVCVQGGDATTAVPASARMVSVDHLGVARSRNAAIDAANGRYLLFCDDDVTVDLDGVIAGVRWLEQTGHALALGEAVDETGRPRKVYPTEPTRLTRFNTARTATYEMLIDVAQIRAAGLRFDERFGAGAPLYLADEYIFITDLLHAGLTGQAIGEVFGMHPSDSSGHRWHGPDDAHARAVALNRVFGRTAPLARTGFALRHLRDLGNAREVVRFIANGTQPPPV